jgi:4-carboxymuconolactone decarboxylase
MDGTSNAPIGATSPETMSPEQRRVYEAIAQGPRRGVPLPFLAMLDAPQLADAIQSVGATLRFAGGLPPALRETAILATAAAFGAPYEWDHHLPIAREAGVSEAVIAAASAGRTDTPDALANRVIAVCRGAVLQRQVPVEALAAIAQALGRQAATEIVAIAGYYPLLGLFLGIVESDAGAH